MCFFRYSLTTGAANEYTKPGMKNILNGGISKVVGCVKSIPPLSAAKECFKQTLFSLILQSKINENSVCLKYHLAMSAAK